MIWRQEMNSELKRKLDFYEREIAKSSDSQKCDDVDWAVLCGDMFDMLQKCQSNIII